jgi:SDR family mycofactocin-dependent oxidoreductase
MGKLEGRVAFITGAARGQGRSHALRLAQEGADIIGIDIAEQIPTVAYPMSRPEDLEETRRAVEALDRRMVAIQADVRDLRAIEDAVRRGSAELGPVDIVIANAGIAPHGGPEPDIVESFATVLAVNLTGTWNTVMATAPGMLERDRGGSIVLTSSVQGLKGVGGDGTAGSAGYAASKHGVVGLMRNFAAWLSPHGIRVNTVHPTGVNTPMIMNDIVAGLIERSPEFANAAKNLMPVPFVESIDISNAIAWLVSDDARYVTGVALPIDAGFVVR